MSTKAALAFADAMLKNFPAYRPDEEQEKVWATNVVREIGGFSDEVIHRAEREILRKWKKDKTPKVADCLDACSEAKRWLDAERRDGSLPIDSPLGPKNLDWTTERLKLATDLMHCEMGREAAKNGWIGILHSFARKNARLPKGAEIEACKREAKGFEEAYAKCVRGGWPQAKRLEELGAEMLKRRHELERLVLGR